MLLTPRIYKALLLGKVVKTDTGTAPITSADVNAWAKTTDVDYADLIAECIAIAEEEFNFSIIAKTIVATYHGNGGNVARLPYGPVLAVSNVTADGTAVSTENYEVIGNEVVFDFAQTKTVVVTYTTAYVGGVELALKKMVLSNYEDRQNNVIGTIVTNFPNHSRRLFMTKKNY